MSSKTATPLNIDTPVNYFRDNQYALNMHKYNTTYNIYEHTPFINDDIFAMHLQDRAARANNNDNHRENNENVNTDNCYPQNNETGTDTSHSEGADAMSLSMEHTPPSMIKTDPLLCDNAMDIDNGTGLSQDFIHGINIKTPPNRHRKNRKHSKKSDKNKAVSNDSKVIDAVWCYFPHFPRDEPDRCLCLLQNEHITVVSVSGDIYYVPLPCETQSIWSLPQGLIIQARVQKELEYNMNYPILFSLLNPLEELRPISLHLLNAQSKALYFDMYYHNFANKLQSKHGNANTDTSRKQKRNKTDGFESPKKRMPKFSKSPTHTIMTPKNGFGNVNINGGSVHGDFFWDNHEILIFSSETQPIIVTYNTKSYFHTIWVIRHAKKEINKRLDKSDLDSPSDQNKHKPSKVSMIENATILNLSDSDDDKMLHHSNILNFSLLNDENNNELQNMSKTMNQTSISSIRGLLAGSGHHSTSRRINKQKWSTNKKGNTTESPIPNLHFNMSPIPHNNEDYFEEEEESGLHSELFVECCWKEHLGLLYDKIKSIYGSNIANSIDFNERGQVMFACDIYNDPLICIFRPKCKLIASYRLKCKNLNQTFSGKCGAGVTDVLTETGSTSLNIELLFIWCGITDIKPIRSLRSLSHCDDDDYHYYQFYSLHQYNNGIQNSTQQTHMNSGNDDFESMFESNGQRQSHSLLHQMQEMSSFDYDLLVLNDFTKSLSIYSANYKLCDIVLPKCLNISMIKSLSHAVNNRVTLDCVNNKTYRIVIPRWDKNIRVIAVLKCFQLFLTPDLMHCIRILLVELHNMNYGKLWHELCQIILYFIVSTGPNTNTQSKSKSKSKLCSDKKQSLSAWERLQRSDYHKQMMLTEPVLSKLSMGNEHKTNNRSFEENKQNFVDQNIGKKIEYILSKFDKLSQNERNDKSKWDTPNEYMDIKSVLSQIDDQYRFNILLSIHLLYENCKLSMLLKSHLEPLVILLSKLSLQMGMYSYFDVYCRDFAHKIIPQLSKYKITKHLLSKQQSTYNDKNICPVPTIYETIIQCLRGNRKALNEFPLPSQNLLFDLSTVLSPEYNSRQKQRKQNSEQNSESIKNSPFYTGSVIFSPLLGPYSLLRKVCYFYDILSAHTRTSLRSKYSLRNVADNSYMNIDNSYNATENSYNPLITPYTPTSMKKTRSRLNTMMSPSTLLSTMDTFMTNKNCSTLDDYPFFSPSFLLKQDTVYDANNSAEQLVLAMVEENFTLNDIDCLPLGIALPLREALRSCKYNPTHNWPKDAYLLIGREDLTNKGVISSDKDLEIIENETKNETENELFNNSAASPLGSTQFSNSMRSSKTFMRQDHKYKYEFGPNRHIQNECYSGKRYQVKKLLQNIGPPSPKLFAVNDINAIHKSSHNIRSATKTLKSLFMTSNNILASSMVKSTRQRLMSSHVFDEQFIMSKVDYDGTLTVLDECLLQFGADYRLKEVRRILRSDKARRIRDVIGNGRINSNVDHGRSIDSIPEYHINLFHQIKRRIAQCLGRGMFTIWSYCPTATKPIDIPLINLCGIVPSRNLKLDLDFTVIQNAVNAYLTYNINNNDDNDHNEPEPPHYLSTFDDIIFQEYEEVDNDLFLQWVSFHNGCSAGLRVLSNYDESRENIRTWICYNKPKMPSYANAGFLFAQGLNGHLTCLMPADFYWYLGHKHEPTTMAIILGLSIARRGTMDTYVHKICCLHIASMVPGGFAELGIETTVQASALLGVGFLFLGTKHKLSTDMLLVEMVRRSSSSAALNSGGNQHNNSQLYGANSEDRECYSLCAGIALGLIHLGLGDSDHNLENRLEQLMGGSTGKRCKMLHYLYDIFNARTSASSNYTGSSRPVSKYGINTGIPGGAGANSQATSTGVSVFATSNIINPSIAAHHQNNTNQSNKNNQSNHDEFSELISGKNHLRAAIHTFMPNFSDFPDINGGDLSYGGYDDEFYGNSRIRDGQWINTDMTAPGAIFAFGLMYLKTNNKSAAKRLIIPNKPYLLDHIQPEWIYLKVVCKCIILWNSINCKQSYFSKQIPQFIQNNFPYKHLIKPFGARNGNQSNEDYNKPNIDYHAITLAFINIISATCFAIGLKYAGTHNKNAHGIIYHYLLQFLNCRKSSLISDNALNIDRYTIETILGIIALSLSLVMCGSGDLDTFKIFRELRMCLDSDITYGHHQMYSMCIGFLFFGGGKLTLGNSKLAIASLLISCYPRFPTNTLDNRFHLQMLRHLYVLAIEKRHITTIDIDTNLPVTVRIQITLLKPERIINKTTPCLLPDYNKISNIKIISTEFWDIEFANLQINCNGWKSIIDNGIIYVKRKSGYSSHKKGHDTQYQYNNIVNVLNNHNNQSRTKNINVLFDSNKKKQCDLVKAFGADPNILAFAKQFASPFTAMGKFCGYALYECLSNAKPEMIQTYIKLYYAISDIQNECDSNNNFIVWDIKLLHTFYANRQYFNMKSTENETHKPLIQKEFIAALQNTFETLYRSVFEDNHNNLLSKYIKNGWNLYECNESKMLKQLQNLGAFLSYSEIDTSLIISNALKSLNTIVNISTNNKVLSLLPLLSIAIRAELKKINSRFGYYGVNSNNIMQNTPSISSFGQTPTFGQTPKHFSTNHDYNNNKNNVTCLPKSFGLSVLTNVLTK